MSVRSFTVHIDIGTTIALITLYPGIPYLFQVNKDFPVINCSPRAFVSISRAEKNACVSGLNNPVSPLQ